MGTNREEEKENISNTKVDIADDKDNNNNSAILPTTDNPSTSSNYQTRLYIDTQTTFPPQINNNNLLIQLIPATPRTPTSPTAQDKPMLNSDYAYRNLNDETHQEVKDDEKHKQSKNIMTLVEVEQKNRDDLEERKVDNCEQGVSGIFNVIETRPLAQIEKLGHINKSKVLEEEEPTSSTNSMPCISQISQPQASSSNVYASDETTGSKQAAGYQAANISRGRKFWDNSRRSLARIISSATTTISNNHPQQSSSSRRGSATISTSNNNNNNEDSLNRSSNTTSRVSSCELVEPPNNTGITNQQLFGAAKRQHLINQQQRQTPGAGNADGCARSHSVAPSTSSAINFSHKLCLSKSRALSCQHQLTRYGSSSGMHKNKPKSQNNDKEQFNGNARCVLNVGGSKHEVLWSTLLRIPKTRLWRLAYTACFLLQSTSAPDDATAANSLQTQKQQQQQPSAQRTSSLNSSQPQLNNNQQHQQQQDLIPSQKFAAAQLSQQKQSAMHRPRRYTMTSRASSMSAGQMASGSLLNSNQQSSKIRDHSIGNEDAQERQALIEDTDNSKIAQTQDGGKNMAYKSLLQYCDDFNLETNEFFFDRQPRSFICILDYYRTGKLHLSDELCVMAFKDDLDYWEIEDYNLDSCCQQRYHQRRDNLFEEMRKEMESLKEHDEEMFGTSKIERYQKFVWDLLEKPQTSLAARVSL